MKSLRVILLILISSISMMFLGCSQTNEQSTNTITKEEYTEELKNTVKKVFEEEVYTNKDKILAFNKDMKNKADKDEQSNLWYYNDQIYLLTVKSMYQDLYNKICNLNCSDESISNIHKTLISQMEDITQVSSTLLKYYSENNDPKSLNSSIPDIKLIFTENPNECKVTEIVKNELEGCIRRVNGFIEGIIGVEVKELSDDILISPTSEDNKDNTSKNNTSSDSNNIQSNITKAIDLIYKATGEDRSYIMVEHISNPGTYVDSSKYYVFSLSARDGSFVSDVNYVVDKTIVRGLDYYKKTAFEIISNDIGSQSTVCGGGRYDGLVEQLGGPKGTSGIGFALGAERLLLTMENNNIEIENPQSTDIYIVTIGDEAKTKSFKLLKDLRYNHISADSDHLDRSVKAQFKYSDKINAKFTIVIGEDELANDSATLKNMQTSEQITVKLSELVGELKNRL